MADPRVHEGAQGADCDPASAWDGWRHGWGVLFAAIWLIFLVPTALDAWDRNPDLLVRIAGGALLAAFVVTYLFCIITPFGVRRNGRFWLVPLLLFSLSLVWLPLAGESALGTWVFVAVAAHATLSGRQAIAASALLILVSAALSLWVPGWNTDAGYPISILAASMAMFGVVKMAQLNRALYASQQEQARLAVLEERERFGRDLHDILGHSLTVIVVKSELAGKLADRDPDRARAEIADIERLAREALADVRSTAAGVREVTLVGELASARTALVAAGIEPDLPSAVDDVPGELRELYGYVVREAVTNVVRHSGASRCLIRVERDGIEVRDDGRGGAARGADDNSRTIGSGLIGLGRRVEEVGLHFEAGPAPDGGFRVAASTLPARAMDAIGAPHVVPPESLAGAPPQRAATTRSCPAPGARAELAGSAEQRAGT
ncbi:MAG TPA: sensor histidine kinase [Candidatus Nanopelagicales bacterium]